jgi:hypothetical protein
MAAQVRKSHKNEFLRHEVARRFPWMGSEDSEKPGKRVDIMHHFTPSPDRSFFIQVVHDEHFVIKSRWVRLAKSHVLRQSPRARPRSEATEGGKKYRLSDLSALPMFLPDSSRLARHSVFIGP